MAAGQVGAAASKGTGEAKGRGAGHASIQMTEGAKGHCHLRGPSRTLHHPAGAKGEPTLGPSLYLLCTPAELQAESPRLCQ